MKFLEDYELNRMTREEVCDHLDIGKTRFYELRKLYRHHKAGEGPFFLYNPNKKAGHCLYEEVCNCFREVIEERKEFLKKQGGDTERLNFGIIEEEVHKRIGQKYPRNTIRRWAIRNGYCPQVSKKDKKPYRRFETDSIGKLFQHDTSIHAWVPGYGKDTDLIVTMDDHSRRILKATLVEQENAWEHIMHMEEIFKRTGRPMSLYTDKHPIFKTQNNKQDEEGKEGVEPAEYKIPDFARMMRELDINLIYANSAEAKGKIERMFQYLQERIPYNCDKCNARTLEIGQRVVDEVVEYYNRHHKNREIVATPNQRWEKAIEIDRNSLRPVEDSIDWDYIAALHCSRKTDGYGRISYKGKKYQTSIRDKRLTVSEREGEKISIYDGLEKLESSEIDASRFEVLPISSKTKADQEVESAS